MTGRCKISDLLGKTMKSVTESDNEIIFRTINGVKYSLHHEQDCCEDVYIEDINGNLEDLVGSPITLADESYNNDNPKEDTNKYDSFTWSFYRFATVKGYVDVRFYGTSNGYYSEIAQLYKEIEEE